MILQDVAWPFPLVAANCDPLVLQSVAVGNRWSPVIDKELLSGCVLHEARVLVVNWQRFHVWVYLADRAGAMKAGRVALVRKRKVGGVMVPWLVEEPTYTSFSGEWWPSLRGALANRGCIAEGFTERVDYMATDRRKPPKRPTAVVGYEYRRAKALRESAQAYAAAAQSQHAGAAARYLQAAQDYEGEAIAKYTTVMGVAP